MTHFVVDETQSAGPHTAYKGQTPDPRRATYPDKFEMEFRAKRTQPTSLANLQFKTYNKQHIVTSQTVA